MGGGMSLREVGVKWGIRISTLHHWVKRYEAGAKEGEVRELVVR